MEEVALSLSGGGYRAALFHLGTLSYLNHLKLPDGRPFLDIINTISTISGGTITGLWYIMNYCTDKNANEYIWELYSLLETTNLPQEALEAFLKKGNQNTSIIKEMIKLYDKYFFHEQTFGIILEKVQHGHIHHFCANGTDFSTGLAFRFQATSAIRHAPKQHRYGFIGNKVHQINRILAADIRLSEILAVSSCFPGGFEPVVFPDDFAFHINRNSSHDVYYNGNPFKLMDGGIVDNQGIEPLLLANRHMHNNHEGQKQDENSPNHDLIIVSDVSSPRIKYHTNLDRKFSSNLSLSSLEKWLKISSCVLFGASVILYFNNLFLCGVSTTLFILSCLLIIGLNRMENRIRKMLKANSPFQFDWKKLKQLELLRIAKLAENRLVSLLDLTQSIFMKPIRQMRYKTLYENPTWKNRLISNNIAELSSNRTWENKKNYPPLLVPSEIMMDNSDKACGMKTTLWFTLEDKQNDVPKAIFTAGQYTICLNLLEYIIKLEKNDDNTTPTHKLIISCKDQLMSDWREFQQNPHFLFDNRESVSHI